MTREEAIKMLRGMKAENLNLANLYTKDRYNALDMAIKALEQEPSSSENPNKWIPVSERLPEKDDLYLICFDDGEYDLVYFSKGAFSYSGVIAWMPLPEPYKAESEVEE